jgi:hypothetical protein
MIDIGLISIVVISDISELIVLPTKIWPRNRTRGNASNSASCIHPLQTSDYTTTTDRNQHKQTNKLRPMQSGCQ